MGDKAYFYKMATDEIEPIHVQSWQLELAKQFSPNCIHVVQGLLSLAFDRALVLGIGQKESVKNDWKHQVQKDTG